MSHSAFTPSRRASPHYGRCSFAVRHRVGGWVGLCGWLHIEGPIFILYLFLGAYILGLHNLYSKIGLSSWPRGMAWMDGRSCAAGTGGKRWAAGENRQLGRRQQGCGLRGMRVQARLGRWMGGQTSKPTAQIKPKSRVAQFWLLIM